MSRTSASNVFSFEFSGEGRELTDNDREIAIKCYETLVKLASGYVKGEEPNTKPANVRSVNQHKRVLGCFAHIMGEIKKNADREFFSEIKTEIEKLVAPHVDAARAARKALMDLPPEVQKTCRANGVLLDHAAIPFSVVSPAFKGGATAEHIRETLECLGYSLSDAPRKNARNAVNEIRIPLTSGPVNVPNMVKENAKRAAVDAAAE